jgi:molybdenum cofactor cytidylyltransferase
VKIAALILAGGASRRMGRPKARLELAGRSFVVRGVDLVRAAGCAPVVVVDGAHRLDPAEVAGAELVHNAAWEQGPLSSLQLGLRRALELEPALAGLLVHHVERPRVAPETVRELITGLRREPECVWQPSHGGRSGHPLLWPQSLFAALLELDPEHQSARTLVRSPAARRRKLELDDPGVLDNVDTPEELAQLRS